MSQIRGIAIRRQPRIAMQSIESAHIRVQRRHLALSHFQLLFCLRYFIPQHFDLGYCAFTIFGRILRRSLRERLGI